MEPQAPSTASSPAALDPDAVNLAKSIRTAESDNNFTQKGASGEYGAYQWEPATWQKMSAAAGVNVPLQQATPEQQNEVAYKQIKAWKDAGYNVGQIASMWNAGPGDPDAYINGNVGTNAEGVKYDTKAYAQKVATLYQQYKGAGGQQASGASLDTAQQPQESLLTKLGTDTGNAIQGASNAASDTLSGNINPLSGLIQAGGALAGGVESGINDAATSIPVVGGLLKGAENLAGKGVQALANTGPGKAVIGFFSSEAAKHPELAGDLGGAANIAGLIPVASGLGAVKDLAGGAIDAALSGSKDAVYEAVSPKMSAAETATATAKRGTTKNGLLGKIKVNDDPYVKDMAQTVKANVPGFNPSDLSGSINKTRAASQAMGDSIRADLQTQGAGMVYSPNELKGVLNSVEEPVSLKGTAFEKQAAPLKKAILKLASDKGYEVPDLLDVRQEFDNLVSKHYPNLYDRENSPIRTLITGYRNALTDFTEDRVPTSDLKNRLRTQSKLIQATENMSEKAAAKGGDIGTTNIGRLANRHPIVSGLINRIGRGVTQGVGIGEGEGLIQ